MHSIPDPSVSFNFTHISSKTLKVYLHIHLSTILAATNALSTLYSIEVCLCETASAAKTVGPRTVRYNSVSVPTPWAVAGPHGQLASPQLLKTPNSMLPEGQVMTLISF